MPYNYDHFHPRHFVDRSFCGPVPAQPAPAFTVETVNGRTVSLGDLQGQRVVLESGSITCPIFASNVAPMNHLARQFPDVTFLVLYSREAHPGRKIGSHTSMAEKRACAQRLREEFPEQRTILIDDRDGSVHRRYGSFPNFVYVLNPDGTVRYRSRWNDPETVTRVLEERVPPTERANPHVSRNRRLSSIHGFIYILRQSGLNAFLDAVRGLTLNRIRRYGANL